MRDIFFSTKIMKCSWNQKIILLYTFNCWMIYYKRIIFGMYDNWRKLVFEQVDVDLN